MRPRKILGLLIPLLQLILVLKLIELVRGEAAVAVDYINSVPYNVPAPASNPAPAPIYNARDFPMYERKHKKRKFKPLLPTSSTTEAVTTLIIEEIIDYNENGTEISRENVTKIVRVPGKPTPTCPDNSILNQPDSSDLMTSLASAFGSRQLQNVRQSTLPLLILLFKFIAGFIAFKTFLLLWKVNYYTVEDPYATSGPIDSSDFARSLDNIISKLLGI